MREHSGHLCFACKKRGALLEDLEPHLSLKHNGCSSPAAWSAIKTHPRDVSVSLVGMLSCYLPRFQKNDGSSPMWFNFLNCSPANPGWESDSKEPLRFHPAWKSDDCNLADNYLLLASRYIYWCCTRSLPQLGANKSRGSFSAFVPSFGNFN